MRSDDLVALVSGPMIVLNARPPNRLEHRMRPENQQRQIVNAKVDVEQASFLVVFRRALDKQRFPFRHRPISISSLRHTGSRTYDSGNSGVATIVPNALVTMALCAVWNASPLPLSSAPRGVAV